VFVVPFGRSLLILEAAEFVLTPPAPPQPRIFIVRGRTIKGILRPESPCDDRCTYAKGNLCECSCGGKNHGINYHGGGVRLLAPAAESQVQLF
jgi:hypothetical protein